jgi:antitoxin VapB
MNINIESDEAYNLAINLVDLTGESITQAVVEAIRERLLRIQQARRLTEELLAIGRDCASRMKEPYHSADHGDLLYDDRGLPR